MLHEIIKFPHELLPHEPAYERQSQAAGNQESKQRTESKAYRREGKAKTASEKVPPDEAGKLSGKGGKKDLQDLQADENDGSAGTERGDQSGNLIFVGEEADRITEPLVRFPVIIE